VDIQQHDMQQPALKQAVTDPAMHNNQLQETMNQQSCAAAEQQQATCETSWT
jgi:hypothetical protein